MPRDPLHTVLNVLALVLTVGLWYTIIGLVVDQLASR
jgi:hypothetical protein